MPGYLAATMSAVAPFLSLMLMPAPAAIRAATQAVYRLFGKQRFAGLQAVVLLWSERKRDYRRLYRSAFGLVQRTNDDFLRQIRFVLTNL